MFGTHNIWLYISQCKMYTNILLKSLSSRITWSLSLQAVFALVFFGFSSPKFFIGKKKVKSQTCVPSYMNYKFICSSGHIFILDSFSLIKLHRWSLNLFLRRKWRRNHLQGSCQRASHLRGEFEGEAGKWPLNGEGWGGRGQIPLLLFSETIMTGEIEEVMRVFKAYLCLWAWSS